MDRAKIFERVEEAKSTLIDLHNYHLNQIEFMDKLRTELDSIQQIKHNMNKNKDLSKHMDEMTSKIESIIHRSSDALIQKLNNEIEIITHNDDMISIMISIKEFISLDWREDIVKTNAKLKEIMIKLANDSRFKNK